MNITTFIKGSSTPVCLLGDPVVHSLSPQIHNHAFEHLKLPYVYIPIAIKPYHLHSAIFMLRHCSFAGANVTIPHKSAVVHYCDKLSELSKITGTVNTLYFDKGLLCGTTTDPVGFKRALAWMGTELHNSHVVILGNGGTARTLAAALAWEREIDSLTIAGRNSEKVSQLVKTISASTGFAVSGVTFDIDRFKTVMDECTILVNCTNAGMHPHTDTTPIPECFFHPEMTVFDAIYNPSETRFLKEARLAGCKTQNGLRMLLFQGLASSKLWTGTEIPEDLFSIEELERLIGT